MYVHDNYVHDKSKVIVYVHDNYVHDKSKVIVYVHDNYVHDKSKVIVYVHDNYVHDKSKVIVLRTHITVHMALVGYFIVFSFVTKPGQTLEFLLWGTIVPLNFLVGYHCSIVASTPQPMAYASTITLDLSITMPCIVRIDRAAPAAVPQPHTCFPKHTSRRDQQRLLIRSSVIKQFRFYTGN